MVKNVEVPTNGSNKEGLGAGADWLRYDYVSQAMRRSISRTVKYSRNDLALSQVARGEKPEDVEKYLNRSAGWQLLWDVTTPSVNTTPAFTEFLIPRDRTGMFNQTAYDPAGHTHGHRSLTKTRLLSNHLHAIRHGYTD